MEECYEVLEAIDSGKPDKLKKELGDLLLQAVFHADVAKKFDIYDVANAISDKLVVRHPHVFGDVKVKNAAEQSLRWEEIKRKEKDHAGRKSIVDGVPAAMPALLRARRVLSKAAKANFKWNNKKQAWMKLDEEIKEFRSAARGKNRKHAEEELGDVLMAVVNVARWEDLEPEHSLKRGIRKFERRIHHMESGARKEKKQIDELSSDELMKLWKKAKKREKAGKHK